MAVNKLTRNNLAKFLPNHELVKAFEELFRIVESLSEEDSVLLSDINIDTTINSSRQVALESSLARMASGFSPKFVVVDSISDLPKAISGAITLRDNYTYYFTDTVDLLGLRLISGQNTTILGASSENCRIKSTGLTGTALITSAWSLPMRNITIEADTALALNASGHANQALDWYGVNFTNCGTVGTIANYGNFVMSDSAFLESDGLTFDGSMDTIAFNQCLFNTATGGTMITLPATLTVTRRVRIIYSSFVVAVGETGLNVNSSATIPTESYILDTVNFSGGGTYTTGVAYSDNKSLWVNCKNVTNTTNAGYMVMQANATATTISGISTDVKVAGTTTLNSISQKFSHSNNRLTYTGALTRSFKISITASLTSGNNQVIGFYVAKNGTVVSDSSNFTTTSGVGKAENVVSQAIIELATNDYVEAWTSNETAVQNITVEYMSFTCEGLN